MSAHPFSSLESFQQAFTSGLSGLLQKDGLGSFILVCANASFDKRVQAATAKELTALYQSLSEEYIAGSRAPMRSLTGSAALPGLKWRVA